jgi:hypothetical protein
MSVASADIFHGHSLLYYTILDYRTIVVAELSYHFSKEIIFMNVDYIYRRPRLGGSGYPYELHQRKEPEYSGVYSPV